MSDKSEYLNEWQQAQDRYRAGVNGGYSDADADALYLAPVRDKWSVLKSVPESLRTQASTELNDAHLSFLKGVQSGYKPQEAADLYLKPQLEKWQGASSFPDPKLPKTTKEVRDWYAQNPAMQDEESEAQAQIEDGVPVSEAIAGHPMLLRAPGFSSTWRPRFNSAVRSDAAKVEKAAQADTPEGVQSKMFSLASKRKLFLPDAPIQKFFDKEMGGMENQLTNAPTIVREPNTARGGFSVQSMPQLTDSDLVAEQHPDWTPEQVKLGAAGKLKGAVTLPDVGEVRKGYKFKGGNPALKSNWEPVQ